MRRVLNAAIYQIQQRACANNEVDPLTWYKEKPANRRAFLGNNRL
jgi:hypothetical protein